MTEGERNERKATVRVASGQGFWGDWLEAPRRQVEGGQTDYLMLDYLAEVFGPLVPGQLIVAAIAARIGAR